ncbi:MAG: hypothetical protein GF400_06690 [Candidatus Eisenbacteria bacterium]|nr:hypothetical protein [Candidatus Eisenbacteria bacterium]
MRYGRAAFLAALVCALPLSSAAENVFLWPDGSGDFPTIQEAVSSVSDGSTIYLLSGTFTGPGNRGITWAGKNISITAFGAQGSAILDCENQDRAIRVAWGVDSTSVISGLSFRNGSPENGSGGAIDCQEASPTIIDCTFEDNSATYGGAVRARGESAPRIQGCVFTGNTAVIGGAVDVSDGSAEITLSTFGGNTAHTGGAVALARSTATFERVTLCRNSADYGAAIWIDSGEVSIEQCIVAFNRTNEAIVGEEASETCYSYVFGNCDGDVLDGDVHDVEQLDPQLCGVDSGDYHPCEGSRCLPSFNAWGMHIGHLAAGCLSCDSGATTLSWGAIKALYR